MAQIPVRRVGNTHLIFNDLVGNATTDAKGVFHIEFDESYFQECFLDRTPDLFFKVFCGDEPILSTADSVLWNINIGATEIVIEVPAEISLFSTLAAIGVQVQVDKGHSANDVRVALFSDAREAKPVDYYRATISWGDGTEPTTGTISQVDSAFSVTGSHIYNTVGRFSVDVTVYSNDGHAATASSRAIIGSPNERFVAQIYLDLLHRPINLDGLARWSTLLDQGITHKQVVLEIENTTEYRTVLVERLYHALLNRSPKASELSKDIDFLKAGGAALQLKSTLLASSEYFRRRGNGTGIGFLVALYQDILGSGIELDEIARWNRMLESEESRSAIVTQLLESDESRSNLAQRLYQELLNRLAEGQELEAIGELLRHDRSVEQITAHLLSSDEYISSVIFALETTPLPDLELQLNRCLDVSDGLIGGSTRELVENQIRKSIAGAHNNLMSNPRTAPLADLIPQNSFVKSACRKSEDVETLGVWFIPSDSQLDQDTILNYLRLTIITNKIAPGTMFGIRFTELALNKMLEGLWNHFVRPENGNRINTSGDPDPNGPIELKTRQLSSPQPNQIVLMIGGTYHTNRDDVKYVDFTVVYTDTLIADGRSFIRCDSKSAVKFDESGINAWNDALSA